MAFTQYSVILQSA